MHRMQGASQRFFSVALLFTLEMRKKIQIEKFPRNRNPEQVIL